MVSWKLQIGAYEKGGKVAQCRLPKTERHFEIPSWQDKFAG